MYSLHDFGEMILDRGRTEAYAQALRARVTSESVVLDIGAGSGILTLLACRAGARKIYAVEPGGVIEIAREAVVASGFSSRVELIQAISTETALPEKVDIVIASIQGALPLFQGCVASLLDARERFLRHGGFMIPERETLWVALVNAPEVHRRIVDPWISVPGANYEGARKRVVNSWKKHSFGSDALLVEPQVVAVLDYSQLRSVNMRGNAAWAISQGCEAHGLCLWFDCITAPGYGFSNSPASGEEHVFAQGFFPWPEVCRLEPGDEVSVDIRADQIGLDYVWSWNTDIRDSSRSRRIIPTFRQSEFLGAPLSRDWLRKSGSAFVPSPNREVVIDIMIMDLFHAGISLEEISVRVAGRFPERFPDWRKALTRVGEMSRRYSL